MNIINLLKDVFKINGTKKAFENESDGRSISYAQLDVLSSKVAGKIKSLGIEKKSFIIVNFDRTYEYYIAIIGIIKAGCAFVPILPNYPQNRIDYIKKDCDAKLEITIDFLNDIEKYDEVIDLSDELDPAALFYTSGSTGNPKGVVHTNKTFASITSIQKEMSKYGLIITAFAPFTFCVSISESIVPLLCSATAYILSHKIMSSIPSLLNYFKEKNIELAFIPPQIIRIIQNDTISLKYALTGSESLSGIYPEKFKLIQGYGQTETLGSICKFVLDKPYDNIPIGKPYNGVKMYVLDENGVELKNGEKGELCVEGPIFSYYFKNDELTKKTFVKLDNGNILVHTGDVAYKNDNDDLVFVSRSDYMVKINGQRVEIPEVEHCINSIDGIDNAAVKAFIDINNKTYLVGYYVSKNNVEESYIRMKMLETLPSYMIPRFFVIMDKLPININGKIDRNALVEPNANENLCDYEAPNNDIEKTICESFEKVLNIKKIGVNDDFYKLGGDSVSALKFLSLCNIKQFSINNLYEHSTPKKLAEYYYKNINDIDIDKENDKAISEPLIVTDSDMIFIGNYIKFNESVVWNLPMLFKLKRNIDIIRLKDAIDFVIKSHPALLLKVFEGTDNKLYKKYDESLFEETCIENIDDDEFLKNKKNLIKPFNVFNDKYYRCRIYKGKLNNYLFFDVFHLVFDGTSSNILLDQICNKYNSSNYVVPKDYIFYYMSNICKIEKKSNDDIIYNQYSKMRDEYLKENDYTIFPEVDGSINNGINKGLYRDFSIEKNKIDDFLLINKIAANVFFMGAWALTVMKICKKHKVAFEWVYNGRDINILIDSIGCLLSYVPIFISDNKDESIATYFLNIKDSINYGIAHNKVNFNISSEFNQKLSMYFRYQSNLTDLERFDIIDKIINFERIEGESEPHFLLQIMENKNSYSYGIEYTGTCYKEETIINIFNIYNDIINDIINNNINNIK